MKLVLNGASVECTATTLSDFLREFAIDPRGVAVAVGSRVIPRGEWDVQVLCAGDCLTLIRATQGG